LWSLFRQVMFWQGAGISRHEDVHPVQERRVGGGGQGGGHQPGPGAKGGRQGLLKPDAHPAIGMALPDQDPGPAASPRLPGECQPVTTRQTTRPAPLIRRRAGSRGVASGQPPWCA
jgi:hypothetical protein